MNQVKALDSDQGSRLRSRLWIIGQNFSPWIHLNWFGGIDLGHERVFIFKFSCSIFPSVNLGRLI